MTESGDRIKGLEARVALLVSAQKELKAEIARQRRRLDAKSEDVRKDAETRKGVAEAELAVTEQNLRRARSELEFERAVRISRDIFEAMKGEETVALEVGGAGSAESDRAAAKTLADLGNVRAMQNFLQGRAKELVDLLRPFVAAYFKAYTRSDEPKKRYPAWFADASLFIALLQDNPLYELTVDQLIKLVGFQRATAFLEVNYGAVEESARDGMLTDTEGRPVDLERIAAMRKRTERTPRLELKSRGDGPIEELLDLIDPKFATRGLGIDALGLDTATGNALRAAGYTMVEQVRASFDTLQSIAGIGPKRAERILDALVRRASNER